ncbi:MAG: hypothetical protein U0174_10205 [Polyangiaceae bacterium]
MTQVVVATHGHCFDGLCSAALFTQLLQKLGPERNLSFRYLAMGYGPGENGVPPALLDGDENAILDYRFSASEKLTWYFDHHVSAFPTDAEREEFARRKVQVPKRAFHDGTYGSCTKLIVDVAKSEFGLTFEGMDRLIYWADMIDRAAFPSAQMAVDRKEPVLKLMAVVEAIGNAEFVTQMVPRLAKQDIESLAASEDVLALYAPLAAEHEAFITRVKKAAKENKGVVLVDLADEPSESAAKFVTYALYPDSGYSVMLTRSKSKCKISVGFNPWSKVTRTHNIAQICERYGGGGHPVVGAVSTKADEVERARTIAKEIAAELSS